MRRSILLAIMGMSLVAWTNRVQVTSEWNQKQAMQSGVRGLALPLISTAQSPQVPCEATLADYGASMAATAALACAHTGPIVIGAGLFDHVALELSWDRDAGTALAVQCDSSYDSMATWGPIMIDTPQGRDIWTRRVDQATDGRLVFNFQTAAEVVRCRFWVDGAVNDEVIANVTLARQASFMDPFEYRYTPADPLPTASFPTMTETGSLTDVAANAAVADRTITVDTAALSGLGVVINLTHVAATHLTMEMRARLVAGGLWGRMHTLEIAAGDITLNEATYSRLVAANTEVLLELPVKRYAEVELIFGATGGGATDLISVQTAGVAGE